MPSWSPADPVLPPVHGRRGERVRARMGGLVVHFAVAVCLAPSPAAAEIIRLSGGRTLSVKAHRDEGDSIVLTLRGGGEIVCARSLVAEILPDEVPYPEPTSAPAANLPPVERAPAAGPFRDLIAASAERHGVSP